MPRRPESENPTPERLRELFTYDRSIGDLVWAVNKSSRARIGSIVKVVTPDGYLVVGIERKRYYAHVIIWAIVTGKWPDHEIDHRNLKKSENWWDNLRTATPQGNRANSEKSRNNKSGLKGVLFFDGKWRGQITVNRKTKLLYRGDCPAAAHLAYIVAADKNFGEFSRS